MKIIHTDNFGGDYPDEKFVEGLPATLSELELNIICNLINQNLGDNASRYYKVVSDNYILQPGFEP